MTNRWRRFLDAFWKASYRDLRFLLILLFAVGGFFVGLPTGDSVLAAISFGGAVVLLGAFVFLTSVIDEPDAFEPWMVWVAGAIITAVVVAMALLASARSTTP